MCLRIRFFKYHLINNLLRFNTFIHIKLYVSTVIKESLKMAHSEALTLTKLGKRY
jgi:hypothetical protein